MLQAALQPVTVNIEQPKKMPNRPLVSLRTPLQHDGQLSPAAIARMLNPVKSGLPRLCSQMTVIKITAISVKAARVVTIVMP
jgi:hypothetical protein